MYTPITHDPRLIEYYSKYCGTELKGILTTEDFNGVFQLTRIPEYTYPLFQEDPKKEFYDEIFDKTERPCSFVVPIDDPFFWYLLSRGGNPEYHYEHIADLSLPPSIRKSYKPLMNKARREGYYSRSVKPPIVDLSIPRYRLYHQMVAGRVTRSIETWECQGKALEKGAAFVIETLNNEGEMVGFGYFNCTKDEALYSVAAYDRDLESQGVPLGHLCLDEAIKHCKEKGIQKLILGECLFPYQTESKKELNISFFKSGFANTKRIKAKVSFSG